MTKLVKLVGVGVALGVALTLAGCNEVPVDNANKVYLTSPAIGMKDTAERLVCVATAEGFQCEPSAEGTVYIITKK